MTLLELLTKAAGVPVDQVRRLLEQGGEVGRELLGKLDAAVTPAGLVNLNSIVADELRDLANLNFEGRRHPSDLA